MKNNLGEKDRMIRIFSGIFFMAGALTFEARLSILAFYLMVTAAFGTCPLYNPIKTAALIKRSIRFGGKHH